MGEHEVASRRSLSETIAINSAAHVRKQQWLDLRVTLQTLVDRNPDLVSIGVRSDQGFLKVDTGHHGELWTTAVADSSSMQAVKVPITLNRRPWGNVEFCFNPLKSQSGSLTEHPLIQLLLFFCLSGTIGYTLFVGKVMRIFSTTQIVPERVRQALDTIAEGLLVLDERARIVLANRAFSQTVEIPPELLTDSSANELPWKTPEDEHCDDHPWMMAIDESETVTEQMLHLQVGEGKRRIFSVNAAPIGGGGARRGALATFRDVTHIEEHRAELETMLTMLRSSRDEVEQKNRELEILATQDALTGCVNRRAFFERFGHLWQIYQKDNTPLAVVMIDNDHFKSVNDTYGHGVGDDVLRSVSKVLREQYKELGIVCRYGGEEFCVLLPNTTFETAIEYAEVSRRSIEEIVFDDPAELRLTASLGVSETRFNPTDPQDLINQADVCLYAAKRSGRNCVVPYREELSGMESAGEEKKPESVDIPYQAVTALVSTLSYRDTNTAEHSRRVADLCCRLAEQFMQKQDIYILEIAALLHDIGKVGVPDDILLKPGKLSREEWQIMSRHDRIGVEIVANAFECEELTRIVQSRHSWFGGSSRHTKSSYRSRYPLGRTDSLHL